MGSVSLNKKWITWIWLILLLAVPLTLWVLPAAFFDDTGVATCPSVLFFNAECLGCGMTRAIMHFHHLRFDDAVYYNRASFLIYPALVIVWFIWVSNALKALGFRKQRPLALTK